MHIAQNGDDSQRRLWFQVSQVVGSRRQDERISQILVWLKGLPFLILEII